MKVVRFGLWLSVFTAVLALLNSEVAADAGMHFDEAKRVVLPAEAATTILKWYIADGNGVAEEWPVRSGDLDHLEVALATALAKANFGRPLQTLYRQYVMVTTPMKNIQVIDNAANAVYDIFASTEEEFSLIFPGGQDIDFVADVLARGNADGDF